MRIPSEEYVQAVTDTEVLFLGYNELQKLYAKSKTWEHIGRRIMEGLFLRKQLRVISFIKMTTEERYLYLLKKKPDLILNVPGQYVASFLGVTPETLSRIRARIT
jgi:CRP-like cAMP-binding protein